MIKFLGYSLLLTFLGYGQPTFAETSAQDQSSKPGSSAVATPSLSEIQSNIQINTPASKTNTKESKVEVGGQTNNLNSQLNSQLNNQLISHKHKRTRPTLLTNRNAVKFSAPFGESEDVKVLATQIAISQALPEKWVLEQVARARSIPSVIQQMMPAPAPVQKNWQAYRARFIEPKRIGLGVQFWQKYASTLRQAERDYGVPPEIIVGILGIETLYGQHMGAYPVLDSLATLSLQFPKEHPRAAERQAFFQNELGEFLKVQYSRPNSPNKEVLGSYAGAIGAAQFMPSSITKFAVDYDKDGVIDLIHSPYDAIGSIANYFKMYGWQTAQPTRFSITLNSNPAQLEELLIPDIVPTFNASTLESKGVILSNEGKVYPGLLALIELQNGPEPKSYLAGTENFYVVTRYNWSSYYAMAVLDLGLAVREAYAGSLLKDNH